MDSTQAQRLFDLGGKLVIFNYPVGWEFAIDLHSWMVDAKFKGLKFIPPGLHLISFRPDDIHSQLPDNQAIVLNFEEKQTWVLEWDVRNEVLKNVTLEDPDQAERVCKDIHYFDQFMGYYPLDPLTLYHEWVQLSGHMSRDLVRQRLPADGHLDGVEFTEIDFKKWISRDISVVGNVRTAEMLDKSNYLEYLIEQHYSSTENFLGEMQLGFAALFLGHSDRGLHHWKLSVQLACQSPTYLTTNQNFTSQFIVIHQLNHLPEDFFEGELTQENFLVPTLKELLQTINDMAADGKSIALTRSQKQLQGILQRRFHINVKQLVQPEDAEFESLEELLALGEDAPTIVEL